jgi:3-hydroxyacyl-[acyl-carrier-protein] dehydratase
MSEVAGQTDLAAKIKELIRRDLKLGDDLELTDETPLFGGDLDLDSLDALLLVSSIEKAFGIKIPNESIGKEIFADVQTLVGYLQNMTEDDTAESASESGSVDLEQMLSRLPHGPAFRFVSRLESVEPGRSGTGVWALDGSEAFFAGHFPGRPIVPGVLLTEALAQLSGIVGFSGADETASPKPAHLAHSDVRYLRVVEPPVEIMLHAELDKTLGDLKQFSVKATLGDDTVAEGHVSLSAAAD